MRLLTRTEVLYKIGQLLHDNCEQKITANDLRESLTTIYDNSTGAVSPIYLKELFASPDEAGTDLKDKQIQVTMENGKKELKIFDENSGFIWRKVFSEIEIKEWIAAASKFEGVVAEVGHTQGPGVVEITKLGDMMKNLTDAEKLLKVGHYSTWAGAAGYVVKSADLNGELVGKVLQTGDWLQLVNTGTKTAPVFHVVQISGDNLNKHRADALYALDAWVDGAYEKGSLVNFSGQIFRATDAIVNGDKEPGETGSKWKAIDLSSVMGSVQYMGRGEFDYAGTTFNQANNWGMPSDTFPKNRQPREGDVYFSASYGSITHFHVDQHNAVTVDHEHGHTRSFEFTIPHTNTPNGLHIIHGIPDKAGLVEISITDESISGATIVFDLVSSSGTNKLMSKRVVDNHNGHIAEVIIYDAGSNALGLGVKFVDGLTLSADVKYLLDIKSIDVPLNNLALANTNGAPASNASIFTLDRYPSAASVNGGIVAQKIHWVNNGELGSFDDSDYHKIDNIDNVTFSKHKKYLVTINCPAVSLNAWRRWHLRIGETTNDFANASSWVRVDQQGYTNIQDGAWWPFTVTLAAIVEGKEGVRNVELWFDHINSGNGNWINLAGTVHIKVEEI